MYPCVTTRQRECEKQRLDYKYNFYLSINIKLFVVWWLALNFLCIDVYEFDYSFCTIFCGHWCGECEVVVARAYIRFLIE